MLWVAQAYLRKQQGGAQPNRLPPSPADYEGQYNLSHFEFGVDPVSLHVGPPGDTTMYIVSNQNLGWPSMQPITWVRDDVFLMQPLPTASCFTNEGGQNWPLRFGRDVRPPPHTHTPTRLICHVHLSTEVGECCRLPTVPALIGWSGGGGRAARHPVRWPRSRSTGLASSRPRCSGSGAERPPTNPGLLV